MSTEAYKRGRKDFDQGRTAPPETYWSEDWIGAWWRGHNEAAEEYAEKAEETERWRGLPASWRAMEDLEQTIGALAAEKVKVLVEAMLAER
ncbi:hypothetical protein ACWIGM_08980 [Bosea sp. NPDC055332]